MKGNKSHFEMQEEAKNYFEEMELFLFIQVFHLIVNQILFIFTLIVDD